MCGGVVTIPRVGTVALTTQPPNRSFDLDDCIGQRSATFRFDWIDGITGENLGQLYPLRDPGARLQHNADRTIPRTLRLALGAADSAAIDVIRDRVLPYMEIGGGSYPLGRYMVSSAVPLLTTSGDVTSLQLTDEMFRVDQKIDRGFAPSGTVMASILDLIDTVQDPPVTDIEPSVYAATGGWSIGAGRGQILDALGTQGDYLKPWMNHYGVLRMIRTFDPAAAVPTFDFDYYKRVLRGSATVGNDLLDAPNRFVVTSNGGGDSVISASSDIPVTAPHSIPNRGFVVVETTNLQLTSQNQAQAIADGLATTATVLEHASVSTPPDPRHDGWDVILWRGVQWLETGWSMDMIEGGEMTHELQRAYT